MSDEILLSVEGLVAKPLRLTYDDLCRFPAQFQVADVSKLDPKRSGAAVRLEGILERAAPAADVRFLTLHGTADDFHASIPLEPVRGRGLLIYRQGDGPLSVSAGGPLRFLIPDYAECHTDEIDECASVKFVDRIELTAERGRDNRPEDEQEHRHLHERQAGSSEGDDG